MDYISIGPTPTEEDCAQVGSDGYAFRARKECEVFKEQLKRTFPKGRFGIKAQTHDYGTYYEVVAYLPEDDKAAAEEAFKAEAETPTLWDAEARADLGLEVGR